MGIAPFTPVPNALLDRIMPALGDTELRLLLVVTRQTLGWTEERGTRQGPGMRKAADWLTQRQLVARTGRSAASVSRALESLVRRNMVVVEDETGRTLVSPQERRRHVGKLFFRLAPGLASEEKTLDQALPAGQADHANRDSGDGESGGSKDALPEEDRVCGESVYGVLISPHAKVHTTKESYYKKRGAASKRNTQNTLPGTGPALRIYGPTAGHILAALHGQEAQSAGKDWHWDMRGQRWVKRIQNDECHESIHSELAWEQHRHDSIGVAHD